MTSVTSVAVVSPLPAVRAGLRTLMEAGADVRVTAEAASLSALPGAWTDTPDVLVLDLEPGADPADVVRAAELAPAVVVLGALRGDERLPVPLGGRPFAYLPRDASREQLQAAILAVSSGLLVLDPASAGHLLAPAPDEPAASSTAAGAHALEALTAREREVLQLVAEGLPNKTIARRLGISEHTVKFHLGAVMTKLNAGSRTEAVHLGARRGLVTL